MEYLICNVGQQGFFEQLVSQLGWNTNQVAFIHDESQTDGLFSQGRATNAVVVIEISLAWQGRRLQEFYGVDIAANLRRKYSVRSPIIFFSPLKLQYFQRLVRSDSRFGLLGAVGSGFLSFPFSVDELRQAISETDILDDSGLRSVVINHCGLQKEWHSISHTLGTLLLDNEKRHEEIQRLVDEWARSINEFAPDQKARINNLKTLVGLSPELVDAGVVTQALQDLDEGLQNLASTSNEEPSYDKKDWLPRCPPKGFAKVLVADDEPQQFLISSLRDQYGYYVLDQAFKFSEARDLLTKEKPDVVLSDYYFKESSRKTEVPNKLIGDRFIHYALTHSQYEDTEPKKPIVLVTSKATLRTETDIRNGAINCSGANRATDPLFIHSVIWSEARKRGVSEPGEIFGREWTLEDTCRQRLERYKEELPNLIGRWGKFKGMLRDTLRLCRLLSESPSNDDPAIVDKAIHGLQPFEAEDNFSLGTIIKIFAETEKIHRDAQALPDSQAKRAVRNILHGKLEQFSSVSNAVKFLFTTIPEVTRDLASLPQHHQIAVELYSALKNYSDSEPLLPTLTLLDRVLVGALSNLPVLPVPRVPSRRHRDAIVSTNINIVVVEDNEYWRDYVIGAIRKTQSILGGNFAISYLHFDNAAESLASIPSTTKSFAIDGSDQNETKTIAIVDICLPETKEHAEQIRAALDGKSQELATPSDTHGLNLIRSLCSYNYNVPLIVYSTLDSIGDRRTIGAWGVPDDDFLAKGVDGDDAIVRALIRKIEKRAKYVIKRTQNERGDSEFWINGTSIPFTKELGLTFSALHNLCQTTGRKEFSITQITTARGDSASEESKKAIHDQMYRIRNLILETLQSNRVYVDIRELIKTRKSSSDEYTYQFNAEVMPPSEEEDYETDLQQYESDVCRVLVIENNPQTLGEIIEPLEVLGYEVKFATNVEDAVRAAMDFLPHVISLDLQIPRTRAEAESPDAIGEEFAGLDAWKRIRTTLSSNTIGIVVPTVNADKNHLVAKAAQMGIPIRNFISKGAPNWHNLLLKKVADEKRRVFLGEVTDANRDISEPIVEILDDSELSEGVLYLMVNNEPFTMNKSPIARIVGLLLSSPKIILSFETIKAVLGSGEPPTNDDSKNWTKRVRAVIKDKWLKSSQDDSQDLSKKILESSAQGLRLNVYVIDSRKK